MDNLEQFIQQNRESFDDSTPAPALWEQLEKRLPPEEPPAKIRKMSFGFLMGIAAGVCLLIGFGVAIGLSLAGPPTPDAQIAAIDPDYQETEDFYEEQVNRQLVLLTSLNGTDPTIEQDLVKIDQWIAELKAEISKVPNNKKEELINEIIDLHRTKLEVLEKVLLHIQSTQKVSKHATMDI